MSKRIPHAELRDGMIFWRGSDLWFRPMEPSVAEWLVNRGRLPAPIHNDLASTVKAYHAQHMGQAA